MLRAQEIWTSQAHTQKGNLSVCNSECGHHSSQSNSQGHQKTGAQSVAEACGRMPVSKGQDRSCASE